MPPVEALPATNVFFSDRHAIPLPPGHRFPADKYRLLRENLQTGDIRHRLRFHEAAPADDEQLRRVHSQPYLDKLATGSLTRREQTEIGFPWSPEMVQRARCSTGGTIQASRAAMRAGLGIHLAGGTHHAFPDRGQGFCVFNDVAVAVRNLQATGLIRRAVVIDLDVHQGNGTACIFAADADVFTFSMHGERNFPFEKFGSDLDIAVPDGTGDDPYLDALADAVNHHLPLPGADIVFYLAGADPFAEDRYGRLKLTKQGLAARDGIVAAAVRAAGVPWVVVMAGGYARNIEDVVDIHTATVRIATS